jgi:phospholipid/cholesterol/gamma-HCH transport system substrate-binding protein
MKIARELKLGLIFIVTIILFIWGLNFLKGKKFFTKQRTYYAVYNQVRGLLANAPVTVNGLQIGRVAALHFESAQSANVVVEITVSNSIDIPKNSTVKIFNSDLLGTKSVEIALGNSQVMAANGDTLVSEIQASFSEEVNRQIQPVMRKAETLMNSVDSVVSELGLIFNPETRDNLAKSFGHIRVTLENLEKVTFNVDTLVYGQRGRMERILFNVESISKNLKDNNENLTKSLQNFANISDTIVKANISHTISSLNRSLTDMAEITDKINRGEGSLGLLINNKKLYNNLEGASKELDLLLQDMKLHPKRYVHFSVFGKSGKRNTYQAPVPDSVR